MTLTKALRFANLAKSIIIDHIINNGPGTVDYFVSVLTFEIGKEWNHSNTTYLLQAGPHTFKQNGVYWGLTEKARRALNEEVKPTSQIV
tara:strand:- start:224 stop:490 length:267 start_codon:yes stop_codon:yes gene_type:complete